MSTPTRHRVAVVGSANTDFVLRCNALPRPGETVLAGEVERLPGGKGANQATALAQFSVDSFMVACLGNDGEGDRLLETLIARGVNVSLVQRGSRTSGMAFITVDGRGENEIVVSPGANHELDVTRVDLENFDAVLAQMEVSADLVEELARRSFQLILNVAPWRDVPESTLSRCAVVVANELEAQSLDTSRLAHCVVTRGSRGAVHYSFGRVVAEVGAPHVEVVDSVGAGDVFCAAYTARYLHKDSPEVALRFAVTAASLATRACGAQGSLPTTEEVRTWLARAS